MIATFLTSAAPAAASDHRTSPTVTIVVRDSVSSQRVDRVRVGQLLEIGPNESNGSLDTDVDFLSNAQVCIKATPADVCYSAEWITTSVNERTKQWMVRVQPAMVMGEHAEALRHLQQRRAAQLSFRVRASAATPKVEWSKGVGLESISICFPEAGLPPGFRTQLRVAHSWVGHAKAETRTYAYSFKPPTTFRALKYRAYTHYVSVFDKYCLEVVPLLSAP
jgi:hypothetical protein